MTVLTKEERQLLDEKYAGRACEEFERDRARLASGEPLAYVIGWIPFLGLRIGLGSRPLIPRPETEWWTENMIAHLRSRFGTRNFRFLDMCAGSGAIGLAVLKHIPDAEVSFGELVPEHAAQIGNNMRSNGLDERRCRVRTGDLFKPFGDETFDVIAANPPYIPEGRALDADVAAWEPRLALFAGSDGLSLIREIAKTAPAHMNPGGELWCEVDSGRGPEALALFTKNGAMRAGLRNDHYGRPRLVMAYY